MSDFDPAMAMLLALHRGQMPQPSIPNAPFGLMPRGRPDIEQRTFAANRRTEDQYLPPEMQMATLPDSRMTNALGKVASQDYAPPPDTRPMTSILNDAFWSARDRVNKTSSGAAYKSFVDPSVMAVAEPSGVNTVNAALSLAPMMPAKAVAPALVAGLGGGVLQGFNQDANAADSARDLFNRQYEARRPAPKEPGSEDDYVARKRAELEQSGWYKGLIEQKATKRAQDRLNVELAKEKLNYPKAKTDYATDLAQWTKDRDEAFSADQADVYKKPFNERSPEAAKALFAAGLAIPAALGFAHMGSRISEKASLLNAAKSGDKVAIDALDDYMSKGAKLGRALDTTKTVAKSATAVPATGFLGDWIDYKFTPHESEASKRAHSMLDVTDPESMKKQLWARAPELLQGAEAFGLGSVLRRFAPGMQKPPSNSEVRSVLSNAAQPPPLPPLPLSSTPPPLPPPTVPAVSPEVRAHMIDSYIKQNLGPTAKGNQGWLTTEKKQELATKALIEKGLLPPE